MISRRYGGDVMMSRRAREEARAGMRISFNIASPAYLARMMRADHDRGRFYCDGGRCGGSRARVR